LGIGETLIFSKKDPDFSKKDPDLFRVLLTGNLLD